MIIKKVFIWGTVFFIGLIFGSIFTAYFSSHKNFTKYQAIRQKGFQYISPLLYCETAPQENDDLTRKLSNELEDYIEEAQSDTFVQNVSVYFRIPDFGDWIGINESERYTPASLLKVPTMMVYYKKANSDPSILSKLIEFNGNNGNGMENIRPSAEMTKGQSYAVDDLISRMITNSDNSAKDMLGMNIDEEEFAKIFEEVGIGRLDYSQTENFMSVKQYASFFRILYNASYLSRKMSEQALSLLTKVEFNRGLVAGVPEGIKVAHKFGERSYGLTNIKQLHDCGIVYSPSYPYILCVMTRGNSFESLQKVIATISSKVYSEVTSWENKK